VSNAEKYVNAFVETLKVSEGQLPGLKYQDVEGWDSIGHMLLIAELEDVFEIMFDTDDIVGLSSFETGKEILAKYDVEV
jgi:acyl carrier protein